MRICVLEKKYDIPLQHFSILYYCYCYDDDKVYYYPAKSDEIVRVHILGWISLLDYQFGVKSYGMGNVLVYEDLHSFLWKYLLFVSRFRECLDQ